MKYEINNQPTQPRGTDHSEIHLKDYLDIIRNRKILIITLFITIVGLVSFISLRETPIYQATTTILIESKGSQIIQYGESGYRGSAAQTEYFQTQLNLLKSRKIAYDVIDRLELWKIFQNNETEENENAENTVKQVSHFFTNMVSDFLKKLKPKENTSSAVLETISSQPAEVGRNPLISPSMVNWYQENLQVSPIRGSNLCEISFTGTTAELVARIVNAHARIFIEDNIQRRKAAAQQALDWIKTQLQTHKAKLEATKQAIYDINKNNAASSNEKHQNIADQALMGLAADLSRATSDRMAKQVIWENVKNLTEDDERFFSIPEINQNSVIQNLRQQLMMAQKEQQEKAAHYKIGIPPNLELNTRIKMLEQEIALEVERMRKALKVDLDRAIAYEKSIKMALRQQKMAMNDLSEMDASTDVLLRQEKIDQSMYETLLKQAQEINLTGKMEGSNIQVVDKADVPLGPVKPNIFLNILMAIVFGLFLGIVLSFFLEYMDNTIKTPKDVLQQLGKPILGILPYDKQIKRRRNLALTWDEDSSKKVDRNAVCTTLIDPTICFPKSKWPTVEVPSGRVMTIASTTAGEGKSTVLNYFARNLSNMGMRVLLVDCDFQRPTLHKFFDLKNEGGLAGAMSRVLSNKISIGNLEKFSIADIFFLINLRKQSGRLDIQDESNAQAMTAYFQDGRFLHLQNRNAPPGNLLGNMLLKAGLITENQLQDALERNKRTGQPLGYILINAGYISRDKLKGNIKLQTEENLQMLFSWKKGRFTFRDVNLNAYEKEKINFGGDYTTVIDDLGRLEGYSLLENEIVSNITNGKYENLLVLPAGVTSSKPIGQMNVTLLSKFLDILKHRYDIIILDSPPLDAASGNATLFHLTDGMVLVIKAGHLSVKTINRHKDFLPEEKFIGVVLNQVKDKTIINPNYYYG